MTPDEELQSRSGCDEVDIPCANCSHSLSSHRTPWGTEMRCDFMTDHPGKPFVVGDYSCPQGYFTLCNCAKFQMPEADDGL